MFVFELICLFIPSVSSKKGVRNENITYCVLLQSAVWLHRYQQSNCCHGEKKIQTHLLSSVGAGSAVFVTGNGKTGI